MTESQRSFLRFLKKDRRDGDAEGRSGNGLAAAIRDTGFSGFQRGGPVIQSERKKRRTERYGGFFQRRGLALLRSLLRLPFA